MLLSATGLVGCGPAGVPARQRQETAAEPVFEGKLWEYLPSGGVNWVLFGKPATLASHHRFAQRLQPLLPEGRLRAYATGTGVDLRTLDSALVAGFDLGTLYLAETDTDLTSATLLFAERLVTEPEVKRPHPRLTRVTGVVGTTPQSLLSFQGKLLAVAVGDTTTIRIVEAFARQKLKRTTRVLDGAGLRSFRDFGQDAPLRFLAPGPFEGKWIYAAEGLLAAATGVGIAATPLPDANLEAVLAIDGPWHDSTSETPVAMLARAWEALAASSTGQLFGLHEPLEPPALLQESSRVQLTVRLKVDPIVQGLRAAVAADVWEMMNLEPTSPGEQRSSPAVPDAASPPDG